MQNNGEGTEPGWQQLADRHREIMRLASTYPLSALRIIRTDLVLEAIDTVTDEAAVVSQQNGTEHDALETRHLMEINAEMLSSPDSTSGFELAA